MPGLTPGQRWQPAYTPFKKQDFGDRALHVLELAVKGPLFGCRMCGNCLLQETALICPMECPKGLRNGPCGGSTSEYCYVDESRPCVWYKIYERSFQHGRQELLLEVLPPLDWEKVGHDSWRDIFKSVANIGVKKAVRGLLSRSAEIRRGTWDGIFRPVRQPDWWQGDARYHPPAYSDPVSELERRLAAGEFVVTSEISPPFSSDMDKLIETIGRVKPLVTAERMETADKAGNAREEGVQIALELIQKVKMYHHQGVNGIHLMPVGWDEVIPRIIMEADLLPRSSAVQSLIQSI